MAGTARGRRLVAPSGDRTRPTSDRVREAVFNALESLGELRDATVLDLFAGSGALGIEALSRGAASVTFVDHDRAAVRTVRGNLDATGFGAAAAAGARAEVVHGDVLSLLPLIAPGAGLVLADPPYADDVWARLLDALAAACPGALVVAEADRPVAAPPGAELVRERRYGGTVVTFIRLPAAGRGTLSDDGTTPPPPTPPIPEDPA